MKLHEIIEAIDNFEPISENDFLRYAKSIKIYIEAYNSDTEAIAFPVGVTNSGASAIFLGQSNEYNETVETILDWYGITNEDREHQIELIGWYAKPISYFIK